MIRLIIIHARIRFITTLFNIVYANYNEKFDISNTLLGRFDFVDSVL